MLRDDRLETDTSGQHPQRPQDFCVQVVQTSHEIFLGSME
jgi:hypothetical protein